MKFTIMVAISLMLGLWLANTGFAAQRVVLCEEAYSEG